MNLELLPLGNRAALRAGGSWVTAVLLIATLSAAENDRPTVPRETIHLFNGKDLSKFYSWLPKFGRAIDPDRVFSVVQNIDGAPAIRVSGEHWGGLVTHERYANYKLVVEFRWGMLTWEPRMKKAMDSGILLHCQGEDGNHNKLFNAPFTSSVEYQLIEGGTGDVILLRRFQRDSSEVIQPRLTAKIGTDAEPHWNPAGTSKEFVGGWIGWERRDRAWQDVLGFRGARDVEKPVGQWNRIEAVCKEGDLDYYLNGVKVFEGRNGSYREGRLLFQSEGAEIYFRRIELQPLR